MHVLDFVGVFAFAISGGLAGVRRHLDIFGILSLAVITALGGGTIRDMLLGNTPPANLTSVPLISTALGAGLMTFWFSGTVSRARRLILVADALGLGAFAVGGSLAAILTGHPGIEAVSVGVITAVGGGVLRDVLSGSLPSVFNQELYALPALVGSLLFDLLWRCGVRGHFVEWVLVALVFGLRIAALKFHWKSPVPRRLERG